jgi:hypothetical protein
MKLIRERKLTNATLIALVLVAASSVFALPPDPDNAALLYYQAFLIYERPDDTMRAMITDLAAGKIEPDARVTKFIETQKTVIELAAAAAELPDCDWGLKYSEGFTMQVPYLNQTRNLAMLILADARISAAKGDYNLAVDRYLTARKFAVHIALEPTIINLLVGISIEKIANKCIQDVLCSAAIRPETLRYLKAQLDEIDNRLLPIKLYYDTEREVMTMYMTSEKARQVLPFLDSERESKFNEARELILTADEQFYQRNKQYFNEYMNAIFSALELPYQHGYVELKRLDEGPPKQLKENPDATMTAILAPAVHKIYNHDVSRKTFSNVLKAALEIYIIAAGTGKLPDGLPAGLPKDLFSDEDFEYEKKEDGFALRCRGKDLKEDKIHEYEFKSRK